MAAGADVVDVVVCVCAEEEVVGMVAVTLGRVVFSAVVYVFEVVEVGRVLEWVAWEPPTIAPRLYASKGAEEPMGVA
jgi:hypothetical protein